jgi:hypothetical protein
MPQFKSRNEEVFNERITRYLKDHEIDFRYSIVHQPSLSKYTRIPNIITYTPDFLILKGEYPYILVEVVRTGSNKIPFVGDLKPIEIMVDAMGVDYFVVTDLDSIVVLDSIVGIASDPRPFSDFFALIDAELSEAEIVRFRKEIASIISQVAAEFTSREFEESRFGLRVQSLLRSEEIMNKISYNREGRFFHFARNVELGFDDFENRLFQDLLLPVVDEKVCRYTTLESLYNMIDNQTFRMGSNIAMNDRGEIDYVDKYIGAFYKPLHSLSVTEMQHHNRSYISSCTTSEKEDDLTMFRLYGDDSKGVCLCFNVSNILNPNSFLIRRISYARGYNDHPELDLLKGIINTISGKLKAAFRFLYLDIWKHFFKSHDYSLEKEVRVLYFDNRFVKPVKEGWVMTSTDKILSKYVIFRLDDPGFPLQLYKVILGPNCPESQLNRKQFEVLAAERGLMGFTIENSKIESYRKS